MANDKEHKKSNRRELPENLPEQLRRLRSEFDAAHASPPDRTAKTECAKTRTEAVLSLHGVYEDVEKAAARYPENIRKHDVKSAALLENARKQAEAIVGDAEDKRQSKPNGTYQYPHICAPRSQRTTNSTPLTRKPLRTSLPQHLTEGV